MDTDEKRKHESLLAVKRVAKQRIKRKKMGWYEVKFWVPSKEAADDLRERAAAYRKAAKDQEAGV